MPSSCSILTRPTPGASRLAYSQATTAVLWEPCVRGGRFADSLSGWFGLSGLSRSQPNEPKKLNKPKKPDRPDEPDPRHAPGNVGMLSLTFNHQSCRAGQFVLGWILYPADSPNLPPSSIRS